MPLSATLSRARASARSEMSVATTRSANRDACMAWMPHPVPRSSTVRACRREHQPRQRHRRAADAEHVLLAERVPERDLAEVGHDPPVPLAERVGERVRPQVEQRANGCRSAPSRRATSRRRPAPLAAGRADSPSSSPSTPSVGSACAASGSGTPSPSTKSSASVARSADAPCAARLASSTRRAGTRSPRCSAAAASEPQSASSVPTVKSAASRSSRRRRTASAGNVSVGAGSVSVLTATIQPHASREDPGCSPPRALSGPVNRLSAASNGWRTSTATSRRTDRSAGQVVDRDAAPVPPRAPRVRRARPSARPRRPLQVDGAAARAGSRGCGPRP